MPRKPKPIPLYPRWTPPKPSAPIPPARSIKDSFDVRAARLLASNPEMTLAQIAAAVGCHEKTLASRERCPALHRVIALNRDVREKYRKGRGEVRHDRSLNRQPMADTSSHFLAFIPGVDDTEEKWLI